MSHLATDLCGHTLAHPIMNAAGTCKYLDTEEDGVRTFVRSAASAVVVGSITVNARGGNTGEVYWSENKRTLNSLGMPNPGLEYYRENLTEMRNLCEDNDKPLIVRVAGLTAKSLLCWDDKGFYIWSEAMNERLLA